MIQVEPFSFGRGAVYKVVCEKVYKGVDKTNKMGYTSYTICKECIGECYG